MKKFWVSWWDPIDSTEPENCPFRYWITGYRGDDECSICALVELEGDFEDYDVWDYVGKFFPDMIEERFCTEKPSDFTPGDRFK